MGLFVEAASTMHMQTEAMSSAMDEIRKTAKIAGVEPEHIEAYSSLLMKLTSKADRNNIKTSSLQTDLQKVFKKYGSDIIASKADVDLRDLYGIEYAGTALERYGQLIVYGEAVFGDGTEVD